MSYSLEQTEEWSAIHDMWMRRTSAHPLLSFLSLSFESDLRRLDAELRNANVGATFSDECVTLGRERLARLRKEAPDGIACTRDAVEGWHATHAVWMRRVRTHSLIYVAVKMFQLGLGELDRSLSGPSDKRSSFYEDLDRVAEHRTDIIRSGRTGMVA